MYQIKTQIWDDFDEFSVKMGLHQIRQGNQINNWEKNMMGWIDVVFEGIFDDL